MKAKLFLLLSFTIFSLSAQTTHQILWKIGTSGSAADLTIEVGDTVEWVWDDTLPHTVSSVGGSTESFDSGTISGMGMMFSHTFTSEGTNPYQCNFHPGSMNGTITVEENLSIRENEFSAFSILPNPASSYLNIQLPNNSGETIIEVFNVIGKRILTKTLNSSLETSIQVADWQNGLYVIRVTSGNNSQSKRFVKR